jgi:hypothetical protein
MPRNKTRSSKSQAQTCGYTERTRIVIYETPQLTRIHTDNTETRHAFKRIVPRKAGCPTHRVFDELELLDESNQCRSVSISGETLSPERNEDGSRTEQKPFPSRFFPRLARVRTEWTEWTESGPVFGKQPMAAPNALGWKRSQGRNGRFKDGTKPHSVPLFSAIGAGSDGMDGMDGIRASFWDVY